MTQIKKKKYSTDCEQDKQSISNSEERAWIQRRY